MNIPVTFYNELKPGDVIRVIAEGGLMLVLLNDKSVGSYAELTNSKGTLYLVSEQVRVDDKWEKLYHDSKRR